MEKVFVSLALFVIFAQCFYYSPQKEGKSETALLLPKSAYDMRVVVPPKEPEFVESTKVETGEISSASEDSFFVAKGWRVQIGSANSKEEAGKMREDAERKLKQRVYILPGVPGYKLRVGDFVDRETAEAFAESLKEMGYPEAIVVPSEVRIRK